MYKDLMRKSTERKTIAVIAILLVISVGAFFSVTLGGSGPAFNDVGVTDTSAITGAVQGLARVGEPVMWTQRATILEGENTSVNLWWGANSISVSEVSGSELVEIPASEVFVRAFGKDRSIASVGLASGDGGWLGKLLGFALKAGNGITGYAAGPIEKREPVRLELPTESGEVEVVYMTPGPEISVSSLASESMIKAAAEADEEIDALRVVVYSDYHYTNVTAVARIPESSGRAQVLHVVDDERVVVGNIVERDLNENGLTDLVEWKVPHLSEEEFIVQIKAGCDEYISDCTASWNEATFYCLSESISTAVGICMDFNANKVTLSCQNFDIVSTSGSLGSVGVEINTNHNITLQNCNISGFETNVLVQSSNDTVISAVNVTNATIDGIYSTGAGNITWSNIRSTNNGRYGMLLDSTISNHTVSTARFSGNAQHGLVFDGVSGGWFNGITSDDNTMDGIYVTNSGNNTFIDLTLYSNDDGLYLDEAGDSGNNTVQNSNISFNTNYGVRVEEDNVTMSNVTVHNNTAGGVVFNESVNHSVSGSTFENNTNNDIYFFYAADSQNDNIFTTMTTGNATYSLTQEGKITLAGATSPTPAGTYISTYKSLNLTLEGAGGWAYLNITYTNADLNDTGINESSMRMMRYDGATWTDTPGNTTNELNNYEHANISAFNYIYMALGNDTEAPEWVELPSGTKANPTDQSVECDVAFEYNVNATDNKDVHKYGVNNTVNFSITEAGGVLTNTTYLGLGILGLNLSVNDTPANNINYSTISLTVNDTVDPAWNPQPESQVVSYGAAFEYDVDATDTCSVAELTYGIDDEVNFAIVSSTGVISAASLAIGSYPLTIDVNDSDGNMPGNTITRAITITVQDANDPVPTLGAPADNYETPAYSNIAGITFNCSATDNSGLQNISLWYTNYLNSPASFALRQYENVTGTSNSSSWLVELAAGTYTWNCLVFDSANRSSWGGSNRTLTVTEFDSGNAPGSGGGGGGGGTYAGPPAEEPNITVVDENLPPVAVIELSRDQGCAPALIKIKSKSYDADGNITNLTWKYYDKISNATEFEYDFNKIGNTTITLTVVDNNGSSNSTSARIVLEECTTVGTAAEIVRLASVPVKIAAKAVFSPPEGTPLMERIGYAVAVQMAFGALGGAVFLVYHLSAKSSKRKKRALNKQTAVIPRPG